MDIAFLKDLTVIFGLSLGVAYLCYRIRIPVIVGFLITGVLVGPHGLGLIHAVSQVELISQAGVVLLLFTIGLELSIKELLQLKKVVFVAGTAQILLTVAVVTGLAMLLKCAFPLALFLGFLVSLSSTAIVLKILQERGAMDSPHGRVALGILIFQDLVVVPMMLLAPLLAGQGQEDETLSYLIKTFVWNLGLFLALVLGARWAIPRVLALIVRIRSREVFLLAVFAICLFIALATAHIGLSLALGAFLAGLFIAESEYSLNALEGILPFRDVFTSLFFISVGMLLDAGFFLRHVWTVLLAAGGILVLKSVTGGIGAALLHYPARPVIMVGMSLAQIGEFALVLAKTGLDLKLLPQNQYQLFLAAAILTMAVTPFWMSLAPKISQRIVAWNGGRNQEPASAAGPAGQESGAPPLRDHLIIVGFGIGGKHLARAAIAARIPYVVAEMNPDTVRAYARLGIPILFGDASTRAVLEHMNVAEARVMALVLSDPISVRRITELARSMNPALTIIVRTRFMGEIAELRRLGADSVIVEEFEASIEVFHRVLARYLVPLEEIQRFTHEVRAEGYGMLRSLDLDSDPFLSMQEKIASVQMSTVAVEPNSGMENVALVHSGLRHAYNVSVVAVRRNGAVIPNPDASFVFRAGDAVYLFGEHDDILRAVALFNSQPERP